MVDLTMLWRNLREKISDDQMIKRAKGIQIEVRQTFVDTELLVY